MKPAIWCIATIVTSPVSALALLIECVAGWFEIGRDAGTDWIDEEPTP